MLTVDQLKIDPVNTCEKIIEYIRNMIKTAHTKSVVVAVSGGVDSSVALMFTVKALGPRNVMALTLPERDITPKTDVDDVMRFCAVLGVTCEHIEITPILQVMRENIPAYDPGDRLAYGNMKARLRMVLTYYYANKSSSMVIGTSNKTELYLGYYTKYGDGGVDIMPLADLYKYQIRALGRHLGIPRSITEKPASARLWIGQNTEKDLGLPYDSLDLIVYAYLKGWTPSKIASEIGVDQPSVEKIIARIIANEHKRLPPAILRLR
ncbi:MAG: NAD+ synthase [Candidatus Bathyarchaeota archaeon]|nr:NAD+ synthase [Candidatus Bathyarchaeota archaeon]